MTRLAATRLAKAGLRRAAMEGVCQSRHMNFFNNGYTYCPFCAVELVIRKECDHCGRVFLSEKAYEAHVTGIELYRDNPCPNQEENSRDSNDHPIRFLKNRNTFFCPGCDLEYPAKPSAKNGNVSGECRKDRHQDCIMKSCSCKCGHVLVDARRGR